MASSLKDETIKEFLSKPKNKYLLIVNLADRGMATIPPEDYFSGILQRSFNYHMKRTNNDIKTSLMEVEKHFREKYGIGGYAYVNPLLREVRKVQLDEYVQEKLDAPEGFEHIAMKTLGI